ncbi:hypothetical protein AVEN_204198-1 [Araneus ventricosus]|uniref:Uncharacterized protein n=1 Tax=Araneus ventricosus TaxID=182803 RepID=A0A4Y2WNZ7_ARAVE|nr:hypothetical protein AVEN_73559-1 [Araneus ventricosus]GBO37977.1 hypothetical protein AVEN_204198-1 [Araneus ventricosus]
MHPICQWFWTLPQLPKDIRSPFKRLLRMWVNWVNRKSSTLCNEMPNNIIISSQETKTTIHSPLVEERPIRKTLKRRNIDRLIKFLATNEDLI